MDSRYAQQRYSYDLVVLDLDGTTLNSHGIVTQATRQAIQETLARGIGVTLASGRHKGNVQSLQIDLGLTLPYISSGGARIVDPAKEKTVYYCPLDQSCVRAFAESARAAGTSIVLQEAEHLFFEGDMDLLLQLSLFAGISTEPAEVFRTISIRTEDILQVQAQPEKMTACGYPEQLQQIETHLNALHLPIYQTYSAPIFLEATSSSVNKGSALRMLAAYLELPLTRIMVVGDNRNDISMFEAAGKAVAMGNADPEARAAADLIAPSNDEEGVAWVLQRLVTL